MKHGRVLWHATFTILCLHDSCNRYIRKRIDIFVPQSLSRHTNGKQHRRLLLCLLKEKLSTNTAYGKGVTGSSRDPTSI